MLFFLSRKLYGWVSGGEKTDGDVRVLKYLNLDPFYDVKDPQFYPKMVKYSPKTHSNTIK